MSTHDPKYIAAILASAQRGMLAGLLFTTIMGVLLFAGLIFIGQ